MEVLDPELEQKENRFTISYLASFYAKNASSNNKKEDNTRIDTTQS